MSRPFLTFLAHLSTHPWQVQHSWTNNFKFNTFFTAKCLSTDHSLIHSYISHVQWASVLFQFSLFWVHDAFLIWSAFFLTELPLIAKWWSTDHFVIHAYISFPLQQSSSHYFSHFSIHPEHMPRPSPISLFTSSRTTTISAPKSPLLSQNYETISPVSQPAITLGSSPSTRSSGYNSARTTAISAPKSPLLSQNYEFISPVSQSPGSSPSTRSSGYNSARTTAISAPKSPHLSQNYETISPVNQPPGSSPSTHSLWWQLTQDNHHLCSQITALIAELWDYISCQSACYNTWMS